ncbi:hypothetical protein [Lacipirellula sp.]|uniref:hypothetical protein n=1 Tax=Lacipirellula sp. TaxID=2691419 RepID=UPI003D12CC76
MWQSRWEVFAESLQDDAMAQTAGIEPDDPLLAELKSYEIFPQQAAWIAASTADALTRKSEDSKL